MQSNNRREIDLRWISENMQILKAHAEKRFGKQGRGVVIVDHTISGNEKPAVHYIPELGIPEDDPSVRRMVRLYSPGLEMVVMLLKGDSACAYQVGVT